MERVQALSASRITLSFLLVYLSAIIVQIVTKIRLSKEAQAAGKQFNRYDSPSPAMHAADRAVGNLLEWSPLFLGPLWVLAALSALDGIVLAASWGYVFCRVGYLALATSNGISLAGRQTGLYAATVPGYICLMVVLGKALCMASGDY
eukprot:m.462791 g.462791  ORF g.462791 m.462791 type:complete len:148 (-) comp22795_c0_seq1:1368-1811(-)